MSSDNARQVLKKYFPLKHICYPEKEEKAKTKIGGTYKETYKFLNKTDYGCLK